MRHNAPQLLTSRRKFTFMMGAGLLGLTHQLSRAVGEETSPDSTSPDSPNTDRAYWTVGENSRWWWYERHQLRGKAWRVTGITTPLDKETNEVYTGREGYLDPQIVTETVRNLIREVSDEEIEEAMQKYSDREADKDRKRRRGRPPSDWILSLTTTELRAWLRTVEVPDVSVRGMTCWCHLVRDHSFDPEKIEGLTEEEQFELHAAAHFGY